MLNLDNFITALDGPGNIVTIMNLELETENYISIEGATSVHIYHFLNKEIDLENFVSICPNLKIQTLYLLLNDMSEQSISVFSQEENGLKVSVHEYASAVEEISAYAVQDRLDLSRVYLT